jgi:cytochrome c oxidase subunit 2
MFDSFPLFPQQASTVASQVDALYYFLIVISVFFGLLIALAVISFGIKFRRREGNERSTEIHGSLALELIWTLIPFGLAMVIFAWSANLYLHIIRPPDNAMPIFVVGKQWMWKLQHLEGRREINELHVPVGRPVKLIMTSEDVIHSFFVPAFRIKQDVVPGRYTTAWFEASRVGTYHLFCAEYCGTQHSGMIGRVVVMEPTDYQNWLAGDAGRVPLAEAGEALFTQLGCASCHTGESGSRGPTLVGLFGKRVQLADGQNVVADETYLRESIVKPQAKLVAGYQPIMPTFQGLVSEEGLLQLIAYIQSQGDAPGEVRPEPTATPTPAPQVGKAGADGQVHGEDDGDDAAHGS